MVHKPSRGVEREAYAINQHFSASASIEPKQPAVEKEEDIKIPASNVFIKYSNAWRGREWLPDELALQEKVLGSLILSLILQNDFTDGLPNSLFKTGITIIQFSGTLNPSGMLKVCDWLTGSGLRNVKYVIKGCHRVLAEESTADVLKLPEGEAYFPPN